MRPRTRPRGEAKRPETPPRLAGGAPCPPCSPLPVLPWQGGNNPAAFAHAQIPSHPPGFNCCGSARAEAMQLTYGRIPRSAREELVTAPLRLPWIPLGRRCAWGSAGRARRRGVDERGWACSLAPALAGVAAGLLGDLARLLAARAAAGGRRHRRRTAHTGRSASWRCGVWLWGGTPLFSLVGPSLPPSPHLTCPTLYPSLHPSYPTAHGTRRR